MYKYSYKSDSPESSGIFAKKLASQLSSGDVLALKGNLAAGKTTFTQALSHFFMVEEDVTSPTFTLINEYNGSLAIYHFDCYRLKNPEEILYMGFEDYLAKDGIIIIEWPEIIESLLPKNTISIEFTYGDSENERLLQIHSPRELIL